MTRRSIEVIRSGQRESAAGRSNDDRVANIMMMMNHWEMTLDLGAIINQGEIINTIEMMISITMMNDITRPNILDHDSSNAACSVVLLGTHKDSLWQGIHF